MHKNLTFLLSQKLQKMKKNDQRKENETTAITIEQMRALVKQMPMKLRAGVQIEVLVGAVEEHVIELTEDGGLRWMPESKTLQAYFCGRMWCGDAAQRKRNGEYAWRRGKKDFPSRDLERLFGVRGLRNLRFKREYLTPPAGFELIDMLFERGESAT